MTFPAPLRLRFVAPAGVVLLGGATLAVEPVALTLVALATLAILVPLQAWTYMRYRRAVRAGEASAGEWALDTLGTGGALLIGYLTVVSSIWLDAADWPSVGTLEWPVLVLACMGLGFQFVLLGHWTVRRMLPLRRWGWRAIAVTAGLVAVRRVAFAPAFAGLGVTSHDGRDYPLFRFFPDPGGLGAALIHPPLRSSCTRRYGTSSSSFHRK